MRACVLAGVLGLIALGCDRGTLLNSGTSAASLAAASDRSGCPDEMLRVRTETVDVCVELHERPGFGENPRAVDYEEAERVCAEADARLCTEREWEVACRGPEGLLYPYGDVYRSGVCVVDQGVPAAIGTRNGCRSGFGLYDMSGNAAEWVEGRFAKGGDHGSDAFGARCGARARPAQDHSSITGVRCCAAPGDAQVPDPAET